jgi:hypothetical protein
MSWMINDGAFEKKYFMQLQKNTSICNKNLITLESGEK